MKYFPNINYDIKWIHGVFSAKENSVGFHATYYEILIAVT
jgi:hypothetical protein